MYFGTLCDSVHCVIKVTVFTLRCALKPRELLCDLVTERCCTVWLEYLTYFLNASEALVDILVNRLIDFECSIVKQCRVTPPGMGQVLKSCAFILNSSLV